MYRIKKEIPLEDLKKFGYEKKQKLYVKKIFKYIDYTYFEVFINTYTREIDACDGYSFYFKINDEDIKIYIEDLIQANIVEKV